MSDPKPWERALPVYNLEPWTGRDFSSIEPATKADGSPMKFPDDVRVVTDPCGAQIDPETMRRGAESFKLAMRRHIQAGGEIPPVLLRIADRLREIREEDAEREAELAAREAELAKEKPR